MTRILLSFLAAAVLFGVGFAQQPTRCPIKRPSHRLEND